MDVDDGTDDDVTLRVSHDAREYGTAPQRHVEHALRSRRNVEPERVVLLLEGHVALQVRRDARVLHRGHALDAIVPVGIGRRGPVRATEIRGGPDRDDHALERRAVDRRDAPPHDRRRSQRQIPRGHVGDGDDAPLPEHLAGPCDAQVVEPGGQSREGEASILTRRGHPAEHRRPDRVQQDLRARDGRSRLVAHGAPEIVGGTQDEVDLDGRPREQVDAARKPRHPPVSPAPRRGPATVPPPAA